MQNRKKISKNIFVIFYIFLVFLSTTSCKSDNENVKYVNVINSFEDEKISIFLNILNDYEIITEFKKVDLSENPYIYKQNTFSKEYIYFNVFRLTLKSKLPRLRFRFLDARVKDIDNNFLAVYYDKSKLLTKLEAESSNKEIIEKYTIILDKTYISEDQINLAKDKTYIYYFVLVSDKKLYLYEKDFMVNIRFLLDDMPKSFTFLFKSNPPQKEEQYSDDDF
jgi:hypothetical protein